MARLVEVWGVGPNQARKTYQKLYDREAYNAKSRASLENKYAGIRKAANDNIEEYRPGKKIMKGNFVITERSIVEPIFTPYYCFKQKFIDEIIEASAAAAVFQNLKFDHIGED